MAITCAADFKVTPNSEVIANNSEITPKFNTESEFSLKRHSLNWVSGLTALTLNQNMGEHNYYNSEFNDRSYTILTDT